nr:queuosine precursor transporter [Methanosarcina horonobensis]
MAFTPFFAPAAVFIYPFIAQVVDMINEVYGEKRTHISILIAFATQVLFVLFIGMVAGLTPAPFFELEDAWKSLFGLSIRITIASWVSFLICSNLDAWIFASLKKTFFTKGGELQARYPDKPLHLAALRSKRHC